MCSGAWPGVFGDNNFLKVRSDGECRSTHLSARHAMFFVKSMRACSHVEVDNTRCSRSVEAFDVKDGLGMSVDAQFLSLFD